MIANNSLSVFASIKGIGSASGLHLKQNFLYVIGDNSAYLYEYNIDTKSLNKIEILANLKKKQNIPKAEKPDFEVLCNFKDSLYILGSGSTANRTQMVEYHLKTKKITHHNLSPLYEKIRQVCKIDDDNLNIEGAIYDGRNWFLFNRGNGNAQKNGIIKIDGSTLTNAHQITFIPIVLLKTNQKLVSFTDAVSHGDTIYFIAAAENTESTYHDGEILGSYIGCLDMPTMKLKFTQLISSTQKFEGITVYKQQNEQLQFLLCEDRDTDVLETVVFKVII